MEQVGWAGACLYNERTGRLIDGHARKALAADQGGGRVPVLVGSWDEAQEALILATLDPLAALAAADADRLGALLADIETGNDAVRRMLDDLAAAHPTPIPVEAPDEFPAYDESIETQHRCPKCGYEWSGGQGS
jgi:hypothetical protein